MRQIIASPQFLKDLKRIPTHVKRQADKIIISLKNNPINPVLDIKKMRGITPSIWRARVGSYRLIYSFDSISLIMLRFCHRKDVYRHL